MPGRLARTSLRAQTDWIRERHPGTLFELTGAVPTIMGPTLEQYDRLAGEYPDVAARVRLVRVAPLPTARRLGETTEWARASSDDGDPPFVLTLNRSVYSRPGRMARENRRLVDARWHPSGSFQVEATLTHEFGHLVMYWLEDAGYDPTALLRRVGVRTSLSAYGSLRIEEAWAEAFRAHYHGDEASQRHVLTRAVMEFIHNTLRAIREGVEGRDK